MKIAYAKGKRLAEKPDSMEDLTKRRFRTVADGVAFVADLERPHVWGNSVWAVEGVESPEPPDRPEDPDRSFVAAIRLARLGEAVSLPETISVENLLAGDSNFRLAGSTEPRELTIVAGQSPIPVFVTLVRNQSGRLGGIMVQVPAAKSPRTAYQVARSVFNGLQMQTSFEHDLSIREAAIAVWELDGKTFVMRAAVPYPELTIDLSRQGPSLIMQRLLAPYADAVNSNSPYYSFLIFFALLDFMVNSWVGAIRQAYESRQMIAPKRSFIVKFDEIYELAPWYFGKSYHDILRDLRHLRNAAGGPHFDFAIGPRVLTVRADDEIACYRDVLRLIVKDMLRDARSDVQAILDTGIEEDTLAEELQDFFARHHGHKKSKTDAKKRH